MCKYLCRGYRYLLGTFRYHQANNLYKIKKTRINSAGALLAIRLLSEVIPHYIRTPSVSIRTVL